MSRRFPMATALAAALQLVALPVIAGDLSPPFPATHQCYWEPDAPSCRTLTHLMRPDWTQAQDLIVLPHRGYWGFGDVATVPENSRQGYQNVSAKGYDYSEVDFMPSLDGVVMSHDYVLFRVTSAPPDDTRRIYDMATSAVTALEQRDRFGNVRAGEHVQTAEDTLQVFSAGGREGAPPPLIFADIKQKPDGDPEQYARNWVNALSAILERTPESQLYQIVVKTPYSPRFIVSNLSPSVRGRFLQVMWMPQVASDGHYNPDAPPPGMAGEPVKNSADFVDLWAPVGAVAAFETNWKSPNDSRLQPFTRGDVTYKNILDYIKQTTGLRGGVFAEEPVGERGVVNRNGVWEVKNAADDMRGDFLFEAVVPVWGGFMVVTTDRPDVWQQVKARAWPTSVRSSAHQPNTSQPSKDLSR